MKNVYLYLMLVMMTGAYAQTCSLNGDFESALSTPPYTFSTFGVTPITSIQDCSIVTTGYPAVAIGGIPLNSDAVKVSLVSPAAEPTLSALGITSVSTVHSGNRAIRLNYRPNSTNSINGLTDVTTMVKTFVPTAQAIDFSFSLIVDNPNHPDIGQQPFFTARLLDSSNRIIDTNEMCVQTDPTNCIFNSVTGSSVLYTGWQCARMNIPAAYINQTIKIEFIVSDCGQGGHAATVYIDDICTTNCSNPVFGSILLNPLNIHCPATNFNICGTYSTPPNSTYSGMVLHVTQNGAAVADITTPTLGTGTFCFTINPTIFGSNPTGSFDFTVQATFDINCSPTPYPLIIFDTTGGVDFNNCCIPDISVYTTPGTTHLLKAQNTITAYNVVSPTQTAVYHAEGAVILKPGFHAQHSSNFRGYIEDCDNGYEWRAPTPQAAPLIATENRNGSIKGSATNPIAEDVSLSITPNPSSSFATITSKIAIRFVNITSLDNKLMFTKEFKESTTSFDLNISSYSQGIYVVTVTTTDGQVHTEKLIKN